MIPTREELREVHAIPAWIALRWLLAVIFLGPRRAEPYIRRRDR